MSSYATVADFEAYVEGWVTDDPDALTRLLERATRDVDAVIGPLWPRAVDPFLGLKLNPDADLDAVGAAALSRATCAQAFYRFTVVEPAQFAAGGEVRKSVKGPDFEVTYADAGAAPVGAGGTGRYAPELALELAPIAYLRRTGARARA